MPDIVYNAVKELKDDASAKVLNVARAFIYRPPGTLGENNLGGPGYQRAKNAFTRHIGGRRTMRRNSMRRKTLNKKRYSKKN